MIRSIAIFLLSLLLVLSSCTKDKHPSVHIIKPMNGQTFTAGDTVEIVADLYDTDAVTSEYLVVTNEIAGDTVINFKDYTLTDRAYHLVKTFVTVSNVKYKIVVSAIGHDKLISDTVRIQSN